VNKLKAFILCVILGSHDWTSKVMQGIKPTEDEIRDGVAGFHRYARMYCARCGKDSQYNMR
jgi:hypothetical protein